MIQAVIGGLLIGVAASILLLFNGRIAGISGIFGRIATAPDKAWRLCFLGGILLGGAVLAWLQPGLFAAGETSTVVLAGAGVLVGVGTQLSNGCTSGHGVCGIGRGSQRSIAATLTFMAVAALVVAGMK